MSLGSRALTTSEHAGLVNEVVFWGATGQAKVLRDVLGTTPRLLALFDNDPNVSSPWQDVPLYCGMAGFTAWKTSHGAAENVGFLVAIGGNGGRARATIQKQLVEEGLRPIVAIHPAAVVAASARIGPGTQILAGAIVAVDASLGAACIVNTSASVDHECVLAEGVHVCPGARLAGCVVVGENVMIGTGAIVLPRIHIGANSVIGAGAVVTRNVPPGSCIVGNPGRQQTTKSR